MINELYKLWCEKATADPDLIAELKEIEGNEELISDAFYTSLEFGTAGLRGVIGAGTNRMNIYTVGQASQGLADYVNSIAKNGTVAIAYDSRIKSDVFARTAASVFAANGIKVYIYDELAPTPMLSFAVRRLKCDAGVVITASHNPSKYNGYKAYGADGAQLGPEAADYVLSKMREVDMFSGIKSEDYENALKNGRIEYISQDIVNEYLDCVEAQRIEPETDLSGLKVVYTPLNGAGNKPVREILKRLGITQVTVVPEQEMPDGNFPTCPYPNPEIRQAFEYALKLAEAEKPDILLATDPDSDRVGIAVRIDGEYKLFSGNDVGVLLLNYILSRRKANGTLPENPVAVKTIVSTELCQKIADDYGCTLVNVLTGFKFIGEQITILAEQGAPERYILGFEESYGYLAGDYARDKDAVVGSMLICEMTAYYKTIGKTLGDVLEEIYNKYGFFQDAQKSFTCEGQTGMEKIKNIMISLRENPPKTIDGDKVITIKDYQNSVSVDAVNNTETALTLPKSNVLSFVLDSGCSLIVRPSGTEPKIKIYIGAIGNTQEASIDKKESIIKAGTELLGF
ncbi:MAG: phospho-sugar mutase [Clostridia bacterium]|nr:phospho-sugar mutase [Clostridia bacterium]